MQINYYYRLRKEQVWQESGILLYGPVGGGRSPPSSLVNVPGRFSRCKLSVQDDNFVHRRRRQTTLYHEVIKAKLF